MQFCSSTSVGNLVEMRRVQDASQRWFGWCRQLQGIRVIQTPTVCLHSTMSAGFPDGLWRVHVAIGRCLWWPSCVITPTTSILSLIRLLQACFQMWVGVIQSLVAAKTFLTPHWGPLGLFPLSWTRSTGKFGAFVVHAQWGAHQFVQQCYPQGQEPYSSSQVPLSFESLRAQLWCFECACTFIWLHSTCILNLNLQLFAPSLSLGEVILDV
ncbi:hypothetical protein F5141DRAFT_1066946 [Pisolithus sp. B1]|nr:hypothetical protein F5141DRAFT_1066946 [Pisolithus sp. B1]